MTNKEIILELKEIRFNFNVQLNGTSRFDEAINEAIKILSNSDEDCISRVELIDKTIKRNSIWLKITDSRGMNLQEIIDELPSIQPKTKMGHWIYRVVGIYRYASCSECNKMQVDESNYCPNCGVRMEGETK